MAMLIDHERAKSAYQNVCSFIDSDGDIEKFRTWALKFPSLIQNCGLLQAIALCHEKSSDVYEIAAKWMEIRFFPKTSVDEVTKKISELDINTYRLTTKEMMSYMTWVKRAASTLIPD